MVVGEMADVSEAFDVPFIREVLVSLPAADGSSRAVDELSQLLG
jgi:hypothetical protein